MTDSNKSTDARVFNKQTPIGFIGAGRLGSSLAVAMSRAGYRVVALSSRRPSHREWLVSQLHEASTSGQPQDVADRANIIFVTVSDGAIQEVTDSVSWRTDQAVVHCSGAAPLNFLDSAASAGSVTGGFHPLQTFPTPEASDSFGGITFGIEAPGTALEVWLHDLATVLGGHPVEITGAQRPAYHAAAVMASGLLAGLTGLAAEVWAASGGVDRRQAVSSLAPLVKSTANWMGEKGLPNTLTGPYVRGDVETVRSHVDAASAVSAEIGASYSALALAALHIAKEQGGLTDEAETSIKEILANTLRASCENIDEA